MTLDLIRDAIPDYARDLRLNLGTVLTPAGAPGLSEGQIWSIALAAALAARNVPFARQIEILAAAINACGLCISSHEKVLRQHGATREQIQSAVRIAATMHGVAGVLEYRQAA